MTKKKRLWPFILGMIIYAVLFLGAGWYGLQKLTVFLNAYEISRPQIAIDAYMQNLTADHIAESCESLVASIDHNIQSEEDCWDVIYSQLQEPFTYAKKVADCTDNKQVFVIRCGSRVIGTMQMETQAPIEFGLTPWAVTSDSFDLSYLITGTVSGSVPDNYHVYVNGNALNASYRINEDMEQPEYFGTYGLPKMTAYEAGPCLGTIEMTVTDENGEPALADQDPMTYLPTLPAETMKPIQEFTEKFLNAHLWFFSQKNDNTYGNYGYLASFVLENTEYFNRLGNSIDGLYWVTDRHAEMKSVDIAFAMPMEPGKYMIDVSYTFSNQDAYVGLTDVTTRLQLFLVETPWGLMVEDVISK